MAFFSLKRLRKGAWLCRYLDIRALAGMVAKDMMGWNNVTTLQKSSKHSFAFTAPEFGL